MRKKTSYQLHDAFWGGMLMGAADMLIQFAECQKEGKDFWKNWETSRTLAVGVTGALGGVVVGTYRYNLDFQRRSQLPFNSNQYLQKVLDYYKLKKDDKYNTYKGLGEWLRSTLFFQMRHLLGEMPKYNGSFARHTAIKTSDIDIALVFPHSLKQPFKELYETTHKTISQLSLRDAQISYRKDSNSIGVKIRLWGEEYSFDVVVTRAKKNYKETGNVTMIDRKEQLFTTETSYKNTNLVIDNEELKNKPHIRDVITLMKAYQDLEENDMLPILIQKMCMEALQDSETTSLYQNFITAAEYITENIENEEWLDVGLTSNLIGRQKKSIARKMQSDLDNLAYSKCYLEDIFQVAY